MRPYEKELFDYNIPVGGSLARPVYLPPDSLFFLQFTEQKGVWSTTGDQWSPLQKI